MSPRIMNNSRKKDFIEIMTTHYKFYDEREEGINVGKPRSEGVIKFKLKLKKSPSPEMKVVIGLEKWRVILFKLGFIGEYPIEKVGYGNLSLKINDTSFYITGSQTGHLPHLQSRHYTKVTFCDLGKSSITAEGQIAPSSESLTHFAIYKSNPEIQAIFHVHHSQLWKYLLNGPYDFIDENIDYGTHEMAMAAQQVLGGKSHGIFAMKGHEDGIVAYGKSVEEAGKILLDVYRKSTQETNSLNRE